MAGKTLEAYLAHNDFDVFSTLLRWWAFELRGTTASLSGCATVLERVLLYPDHARIVAALRRDVTALDQTVHTCFLLDQTGADRTSMLKARWAPYDAAVWDRCAGEISRQLMPHAAVIDAWQQQFAPLRDASPMVPGMLDLLVQSLARLHELASPACFEQWVEREGMLPIDQAPR